MSQVRPVHATNEKINALSERFKVDTKAGHKEYACVLTTEKGAKYARFYGKDVHAAVANAMCVLTEGEQVQDLLARKDSLINELKVKLMDTQTELEELKHGEAERPAGSSNPIGRKKIGKRTSMKSVGGSV